MINWEMATIQQDILFCPYCFLLSNYQKLEGAIQRIECICGEIHIVERAEMLFLYKLENYNDSKRME